MTPLTIARHLLEDTYDYASTSILAPDEVADFIMEWGRLNIPDDALAEDGREDHPHVTVKYGLTTRDLPPELSEIAKTTKPFPIFMGVISLFTTNPKHDVVKIDVESPVLRALNKRISDAIPHEDTYPTYHPHLTVAYVQKGTCDHLDGDDPFKAEGVAREFMAYGMTYSAPGDEDDAARMKTALLFSKGDRPDPAIEEAAVGPTQAQMKLIKDEIESAVAESNGDPGVFVTLANEALKPHGIQFQNHPDLVAAHAPAVATQDGAFYRVPTAWELKQPDWPKLVVGVLYHELVHGHQISRMGEPKQVVDRTTAWLAPEGRLNQERYLQQKQEIMAWAASMVDSWRRQGLTSDQMMTRLRSGNWGFGMKYWVNRREYPQAFNRFVKQAKEYIEQLKEAAIDSLPVPDPFGGIGFPADPDQTRQFLRSNEKRRVDRPIL